MKNDIKNNPIKCLFFDLETVVLDDPTDACAFFQLSGMIEINGVVKETFDFYVNPENSCEYDSSCLAFNSITEADLETYPSHKEIHAKLINIFDKYINKFDKNDKFHVVGFNNMKFDNPKLYNWFLMMDKINGSKFNTFGSYCWASPALDVYPYIGLLFIKYRGLFTNFKLETVAKKMAQMGLIDKRFEEDDNYHNALFDIEATREIFHFCLKMFNMNLFDTPENS